MALYQGHEPTQKLHKAVANRQIWDQEQHQEVKQVENAFDAEQIRELDELYIPLLYDMGIPRNTSEY